MFIIEDSGMQVIIEETRKYKLVNISRDFYKKFQFFQVGQEFCEFNRTVEKKIEKLEKLGITQLDCLRFHLDLMGGIGYSFMEDKNFVWIQEFYDDNDYLPELDFTNKLKDFFNEYQKDVLGGNYIFFKNAIKNFVLHYDQLRPEEIYKEKFNFLKKKNHLFEIQDNLDSKAEFLFGINFLKDHFFSKKISTTEELIKILGKYYVES
ncbi:hypothetical protein [Acinetobacter shaoyimingii]|uniref:Uncharacterized protein n=1 Tax=Acinetobacter shaoyimingii TaxID=2715164 RepID=A0A6G8RSM1_9GAMM|nr:hypothetical protein [Acinetobacter shaoyimingii]QIO04788.1 hypothetical protein G8E00_01820 [Acinetobacter shaoyimingii]